VPVDIVPPVAMTVRRAMLESLRTPRPGLGEAASELRDDGGVPEQPMGPAEPVTSAGEPGEAGEPGDARRQEPAARRLRLLLSVAAVVLALDIVTKVLAVKLLPPGQPVSIIGDTVTWTLVRNSGAAFSMATGYTWVLTLIATGVVVGIFWMGRRLVSRWWAVGLGMILGGAMGNLVDRFFRAPGPLRGHVVDFLSVGWWPVFNVADPSVVGGAILLVVLSVFGYDFDIVGRRKAVER
jgi:signal peptidase II